MRWTNSLLVMIAISNKGKKRIIISNSQACFSGNAGLLQKIEAAISYQFKIQFNTKYIVNPKGKRRKDERKMFLLVLRGFTEPSK